MMNYPSENQLPLKPSELDENTRKVIELILSRTGKSPFEIAEIIRDFEASGDNQLTLYDAQDIDTCEQMKF